MNFAIDLFFGGLWSMVWHWGIGIGLVILLCGAAWFSPVFKKDFVYCAILVAVCLAYGTLLVQDEKKHEQAQQQLLIKKVHTVVQHTKTPQARAEKDRYDNKKN